MTRLDLDHPVRVHVDEHGFSRYRWNDPPTAGSLWNATLGSDWPARDAGLALLDGLDAHDPATVTPCWQSVPSCAPYQRPQVSRVEVGGRTLYLYERGYPEGYIHALCVTECAALDLADDAFAWERCQ